MKLIAIITLFLFIQKADGQVVLSADGPGDTYNLITSVLAPDNKPIEAPDCSHESFGEHIDEVFDNDLDQNVFRFFIHTTPDDDRCINSDRQRNEIKSYDKSPNNLLGIENEKVIYKWKFKLAAGFQSSPNFTHLHQLKSVGGSLESMPMYTLTTRKGNPDRLELRYAETDDQITLTRTDLAPFLGVWVEATEIIEYGTAGTYEIVIKRCADDEVLFTYADDSIINWRPGAEFVRPKWGIYRSLINAQDLRDEEVLFADFIIEEIQTTSNLESSSDNLLIFPNPANQTIAIDNMINDIDLLELFTLSGRKVLSRSIESQNMVTLDVSLFQDGIYILNLQGGNVQQSKVIVVSH